MDTSRTRCWMTGGLTLALVLSLTGNFAQWRSHAGHTVSASDNLTHGPLRQKRSVAPTLEYEVGTPPTAEHADQPYFLPLYTQITESQLTKMCEAKYRKNHMTNSNPKRILYDKQKHKDGAETSAKSSNDRYRYQVVSQPSVRPLKVFTVCQPIQSLGATSCVGERVHRQGAALRKGDRWLLTEFATGNILFQFDPQADETEPNPDEEDTPTYEFQRLADRRRSTVTPTDSPQLPLRFPSRIHTLAESFHGTDHTVDVSGDDDLVFYYVGTGLVRLQAVRLRNGRQISRLIDAANEPLYRQQGAGVSSDNLSAVDLEADDGVLWALFRAANDTALTVAKLAPNSLKELARYRLTLVQPRQVANAFVACGTLHTVEITDFGTSTVPPHRNNTYGSNNSDNRSTRSRPTVLGSYGRRHRRGYGKSKNVSTRKFVVRPVFDFHAEQYLKSPPRLLYVDWPYDNDVSSVQYDTVSDTITVFSNGKIVSIPLKRGVKSP